MLPFFASLFTRRAPLPTAAAAVTISLFAGCAPASIDRNATEELEQLHSHTDAQFAWPSCKGGGVGARCGRILEWVARDSFRERFRDRACTGKSDEACQETFNRFVNAQLATRYFAADWQQIASYCDGHPPKCEDTTYYETLLLDSHNDAIRADRFREEERIEAERVRMHAEHDAAVWSAVTTVAGEVAYAAHKGPKCRSYPSVLTGTTLTTCTE